MFDFFDKLMDRFKSVWNGMTLNQRVVTIALTAAVLLSALFVSSLGDRFADYTILFAQLDAQSAAQMTSRLESQNIPYRLSQGGTAIEVPKEFADKLKVDFIAEGLPQSGIVGYEILDATNFGMSDFLQKTNYKRAMEGELSRTLRSIDEIDDAFVKLVIPAPNLYTDTANPPTASVLLKLKGNRTLAPGTVEAIANLVASAAVEGLDPGNVNIMDNRGVQLSRPQMDELALRSSTVMELKFSYESQLSKRVKQMIDGAFGSGIALVTVNADLDFDEVERETVAYNQENSAIVAEVRSETTAPGADGGGEETSTTNYEPGSMVERLIRAPGSTVRRLTVSVMIDGKNIQNVDENGEAVNEKVPWNAEELTNIQAVCENAVGYDPDRGDRIEVVNMAFGGREVEVVQAGLSIGQTVIESIKALSLGVAIIFSIWLFFVIVRSTVNTLDPAKVKIKAEEEFKKFMPTEEEDEEGLPTERTELIRKIIQKASTEPELTAKTIKSIYRQD